MERPAILNRSMPSTAGATIGIPPTRAVNEVYQREVSSETVYTIYNSRKSIPDGERFLQALNGRFLQFAPISYVSPQNSCRFDPIYHLQDNERDAQEQPAGGRLNWVSDADGRE